MAEKIAEQLDRVGSESGPRANGPLRVGYLAGSGHTGSTLLAMFMDSHPQIVSVGETSIKPAVRSIQKSLPLCSCGTAVAECGFWRQVFDAVGREGHSLSASNWSNDYRYETKFLRLGLSRYSSHRLLRTLQNVATGLLPFHRARVQHTNHVNVAFIRSVLQIAGADVFFDTSKSPMRLWHLLHLPQLEIRVVLLVRDVRGFCSSAKRRGQSIEQAASAWTNQQRVLADITGEMPPDRVTRLRYEDMCEDPARRLKALQEFLQVETLEPPDVAMSREHHVLGNRIRRDGAIRIRPADDWRKTLTVGEAAAALRIAGKTNEQFGYS